MTRLDVELVERGLARSRAHAQQLIAAGKVHVNGALVRRAATRVQQGDSFACEVDGYVSRAAHKLLGALDDLALEVTGRALDAGASTGGFTQVLLKRGCRRVYAVDVGTDQLAPGLRADDRVLVWEQTNLRDLELRHVEDQPVDLVVADVSFISLVLLLEPLSQVVSRQGRLLLMVKPQFEVGRELLGRDGVVRSSPHRRLAVETVIAAATDLGWYPHRIVPSRLPGPAGNVEYFVLFGSTPPPVAPDVAAAVDGAAVVDADAEVEGAAEVEGVAPLDDSPDTYAVPGE